VVVVRKVGEDLLFKCGQCTVTLFAVYLRFSAFVEPQRTAAWTEPLVAWLVWRTCNGVRHINEVTLYVEPG